MVPMVTLFSNMEFLFTIILRCSAAKVDSCCLMSWFRPWNTFTHYIQYAHISAVRSSGDNHNREQLTVGLWWHHFYSNSGFLLQWNRCSMKIMYVQCIRYTVVHWHWAYEPVRIYLEGAAVAVELTAHLSFRTVMLMTGHLEYKPNQSV